MMMEFIETCVRPAACLMEEFDQTARTFMHRIEDNLPCPDQDVLGSWDGFVTEQHEDMPDDGPPLERHRPPIWRGVQPSNACNACPAH